MRCLPAVGCLTVVACLAAPLAAAASVHDDSLCAGPPGALRAFHQSVEDYAALHRLLQDRLGISVPAGDTAALRASRHHLAVALRDARAMARQGSIFTPAAAQAFDCRMIGLLLRVGNATEAMTSGLLPLRDSVHPTINDSYPEHVLRELPEFVLRAMPPLPEEIAYRVFDRDLVLWDIFARTVIDYVPNVLPDLLEGEGDW